MYQMGLRDYRPGTVATAHNPEVQMGSCKWTVGSFHYSSAAGWFPWLMLFVDQFEGKSRGIGCAFLDVP